MSRKITPCEKLGYRVGDEFTLTEDSYKFSVGEVISLQNDDGTESPYFTSEKVKDEYPRGVACFLSSIKKVTKLKPAKQALADAIHKNGGWVDGASSAWFQGNLANKPCNEVWFGNESSYPEYAHISKSHHSNFSQIVGKIKANKFTNWHQCILSRDEYFTAYPDEVKAEVGNDTEQVVEVEMKSESEITIKVSDWHKNGELPPVGEVCEAYIDYPPEWIETEIVAHKDGFAIGWCNSVMKGCHGDKAHEFRPLRTERDRAIDEMVSSVLAVMNSDLQRRLCEDLYDAGYRKEVK